MHRRGLAGETLRADEDRWDREGGTTGFAGRFAPGGHLSGIIGGILIFAEDITHRKADGRGDLRYESKADRIAGAGTGPDRERASRRH